MNPGHGFAGSPKTLTQIIMNGGNMKTATLAALIFTALDFLNVVLRGGIGFLHGETTCSVFNICSYAVTVLFFASLFYFLLTFYKGQKS
jgi:hypothetical protein